MAPGAGANGIYSATYSGVPVFECNVGGNHVMRRRQDGWINATHILKVAEYDKPARTRILEREVQKGTHEKVQGGYGKYQGTWVPLHEGRLLAERNGVLEKLSPILDYVPGNISPPQAPKHTTNSNKPRMPKPPPVRKIPKPKVNAPYAQMSDDYDHISGHQYDDDSVDNSTIASTSFVEDDEGYGTMNHPYGVPNSRKRNRESAHDVADQEHLFYADQLLDYFMLSASETSYNLPPPEMPARFQIDRPIDDQNHTALHWGAAMGDIDVVQTFLDRGANQLARNRRGETPLIRAVLFTNNFEKNTMSKLTKQLLHTIRVTDNHGATILHHIAMTTNSSAKRKCARYYLDIILSKLNDFSSPQDFSAFLNHQDHNGDTALHIVARHNARKCVRSLQGRGARGDMYNSSDETADQIIQKTRAMNHDFISSSPAPPLAGPVHGHEGMKVTEPNDVTHYQSQSARSFSQSFNSMVQDKVLQLTLAFERELREKKNDLAEAQRLLAKVENERHEIRQEIARLTAEVEKDMSDEEYERLLEEEKRLIAENISLSEQIQHRDLHQAIRAAENALPASAHQQSNGLILDEAELAEKERAALALAAQQKRRRELTHELVMAEAGAGMSETGEKMKRLIATILGVPVDAVPGLIPELLEELQQSKMEGNS